MTSHFSLRKLILSALFAALTAVCSQIFIPTGFAAPINLATFAVILAGALLGPFYGMMSQLCYLALGSIGLPVFVGFTGGVGTLFGITGGYLFGYAAAACITGFLLQKHRQSRIFLIFAMSLGLLTCYALGTAWFMLLQKSSFLSSVAVCVLPYLPGDAVKIGLAAFLLPRLRTLLLS